MASVVSKPKTALRTKAVRKEQCWLRLYIANHSPRCVTALANLERISQVHWAGRCHIEIVDLLKHPAVAKRDDILAIPTLMRIRPEPVRRVVGDLSNTEGVLRGLQLCTGSAASQSYEERHSKTS